MTVEAVISKHYNLLNVSEVELRVLRAVLETTLMQYETSPGAPPHPLVGLHNEIDRVLAG